MAAHLIDSTIFGDLFGTARMRAIFSDEGCIDRWLAVEAALARAEAGVGLIPEAAAREITRQARRENVDLARLKRDTELVGYPIVSIVHQLAEACGEEAGGYVHWGATTQDIMDTAVVLQVRDALDLVDGGLHALEGVLAALAARHRDTPMAGRTHTQQALPITFGFKVAVWLAEVHRHRQRLGEVRRRALVGQLGGAVGTLASLGERGLEVQARFVAELGLAQPTISWHVARDALAEVVALLGMIAATLGKIAAEISVLAMTEIGELGEPFEAGRGSSSTMPQKRNPITCETMIAGAKIVRQLVPLALDAMVHDHERATGPWQVEWAVLPEAFVVTDGMLDHGAALLAGLQVDVGRMRKNRDATRGLIVSEALMMALAPHLGRQRAHEVVYAACRRAQAEDLPLLDVARDVAEVRATLTEPELRQILDPTRYQGLARTFVDRVIADLGSDAATDGSALSE